ncbi:MAG TPA: DUF6519 domain-containing protein [Ideonella sp.]|uniref:DUF6519 domain-containing protein n=1 Tax=Ideonella sp. TaxID=1929293 RepID=UPI002E360BD1|nr:DUF6519 domain-containing protein [Ideonella sp.]HEX5687843.1 DUF6519 domain-containing protein [Ideonella sp.]
MKTQISRDTFDSSKRYSGVYLQQGRMIVDADVNEAADIAKTRLDAALGDVVASGAPRVGALSVARSGSTLVVNPGRLYVEGVPARLDAAGPLTITAQPDYRNPPAFALGPLKIYADVWERPVSSLEDPAVQDAGLHGADTATRTRTMLQVKWCTGDLNPLDPLLNPSLGDARLTLKLISTLGEPDACDPCADEVSVDERIGNYLFRTEVHEVFVDNGQTHVVLKWSRDNGAEAYPWNAFPAGFDQGDWVWEWFDSDTENLAGQHFPPAERRRRGLLQDSFLRPASPAPNAFVRQWDGYAEINLTTQTLVAGRCVDRGTALSTALDASSHGYVHFDTTTGVVLMRLDLMELQLGYRNGGALRHFLAGDYWQAAVREAVDKSGDIVLGKIAPEAPRGVRHHYLLLAETDNAGNVQPFTDARRRQMGFPPLTDLHAADVGFTDHCIGLFGGAENVQAALDALCDLGAEDVGYTVPGCGTPSAPSVASLMTTTLPGFPDLDGLPKSPSVKDILDALMCHLNAARLPYAPATLAARWNDIQEGGAAPLTVQQALDALAGNLDAGDIMDNVDACVDGTNSGSRTLRELMAITPGLHKVQELLGLLLCDLRATHLPLDRSRISCNEIKTDPNVVTVQDAIDKLCQISGQGCEIIVAPGQLQKVLTDFAASTSLDISLCLMPGDHPLPTDLAVTDKHGIRMRGHAAASVQVLLSGVLTLAANEVVLDGLTFAMAGAIYDQPFQGAQLDLRSNHIRSTGCSYGRVSSTFTLRSMVLFEPSSDNARVDWQDNTMIDFVLYVGDQSGPGPETGGATDTELVRPSDDLLDKIRDRPRFDSDVADLILKLPEPDRVDLGMAIAKGTPPAIAARKARTAPTLKAVPKGSIPGQAQDATPAAAKAATKPAAKATKSANAAKTSTKATASTRVKAAAPAPAEAEAARVVASRITKPSPVDLAKMDKLGRLVASKDLTHEALTAQLKESPIGWGFSIYPNLALGVASHRMTVSLRGNLLGGLVLFMNELELWDTGTLPTTDLHVDKTTDLVATGGGALTIEGNLIIRLLSLVPNSPEGDLPSGIAGASSATLSGNTLTDSSHSLVARKLAVQGNQFTADATQYVETPLALLMVNQVSVVGNVGDEVYVRDDKGDIIGIQSLPDIKVSTVHMRASSNFMSVSQI